MVSAACVLRPERLGVSTTSSTALPFPFPVGVAFSPLAIPRASVLACNCRRVVREGPDGREREGPATGVIEEGTSSNKLW